MRISRDGGVQPTWRADGRKPYFLALDGTLMVVDVVPGPQARFGEPKPVEDQDQPRATFSVMIELAATRERGR